MLIAQAAAEYGGLASMAAALPEFTNRLEYWVTEHSTFVVIAGVVLVLWCLSRR